MGPTAEHSDGDAEYYQLTNRLSQQYDWFSPGKLLEVAPATSPQQEEEQHSGTYGLSERQIRALGLAGPRTDMPDPKTLSSKAYLRGEKSQPEQFGYTTNISNMAGNNSRASRSYTSPRAAYGDYTTYPEGRPLFLPEAERFGNPPDLPSLLLQQRVIYISMPANELDYATRYYAAILARSTGKDLETCQKQYLTRKRYFSVKEAYEEGLVDKLVPGFVLNRFRKMQKDAGVGEEVIESNKPKFKFTRQ
ncbi:hypothetical protein TSOC_009160 [Tetrabaena socialis]|uniref:Uncharacterized protein n=1 Tax=Tetrabaena socialis TaxID=47790 RepID=A0A2J7ZWL0_9CHLO|nr:hypothetical protein TSOC_009160 [Tetrabaena socialis]|eukprot:PNH04642.1 hypothetical protein TSOC_009160 [Tetrabaena socialis]